MIGPTTSAFETGVSALVLLRELVRDLVDGPVFQAQRFDSAQAWGLHRYVTTHPCGRLAAIGSRTLTYWLTGVPGCR